MSGEAGVSVFGFTVQYKYSETDASCFPGFQEFLGRSMNRQSKSL